MTQTDTAFKASVSEQVKFTYNHFELWLPLSSTRIHVFSYLVFAQEELQLQTEEPQPLNLCRSLRPSLHRLHLGKTGNFEMLRCDFQNNSSILWAFCSDELPGTSSISRLRSSLNTSTSSSARSTSVSSRLTADL